MIIQHHAHGALKSYIHDNCPSSASAEDTAQLTGLLVAHLLLLVQGGAVDEGVAAGGGLRAADVRGGAPLTQQPAAAAARRCTLQLFGIVGRQTSIG